MRGVRRFRDRAKLRQVMVGLVALPLSAAPFAAYGTFTPEGRLVRDRLLVAISPPVLPELTAAQERAARAHAPRYSDKVMALVYHGLGGGSDGDGRGGFVISPQRFGEHLATLRAAGMNTVTASDVARALGTGKPLPPNAVMISFDDGRVDALMWADPLLEQADMQATMFVISSAAADPGIYYASWKRLRAAARSGRWDIQAHTHDSHREQKAAGGGKLPKLTSLKPDESIGEYRRRVRDDLEENSAAILEHVGRRPVAFAYPFGAYGADRVNDPRIRAALRHEVASRYALAFHQDEQDSVPLVDSSQDRVGLRRLEVGDWSGLKLLDAIERATPPAGNESGPDEGPPVSPPVVPELPPIPFLPELREDPAPIPPESKFEKPPVTTTATTTPAPAEAPVIGAPSAPTVVPTDPSAGVGPSPTTTTTTTPATPPPASTTTTSKNTTPTKPPGTTTTTKPRPTTTTTKPRPTTTTKPPTTTTTTICLKVNGKPCWK